MTQNPAQKLVAEFLGTAFLLAAVAGSGIMGQSLAAGNTAIALLANSIATGAALVALILTFGPVSGAHFNPVVTLAEAMRHELSIKLTCGYIFAQIAGACLGVLVAHAMFGLPLVQHSLHVRTGAGQWIAEFIATTGLLIVISSCARHQPSGCPYAVAAYITAAYWFTASTSFANPAVTFARMFTNTFAGIAPANAPLFILCQIAAVPVVVLGWRWLSGEKPDTGTI